MSLIIFFTIVAVVSAACLSRPSETVVLPVSDATPDGESTELEIVTLLGYDSIPAILSPNFADIAQAEQWMSSDEQVLGVSINGDNRAYPIPVLSRHEIVNDTVGGVPVAITW
jgi:hypothetical protein